MTLRLVLVYFVVCWIWICTSWVGVFYPFVSVSFFFLLNKLYLFFTPLYLFLSLFCLINCICFLPLCICFFLFYPFGFERDNELSNRKIKPQIINFPNAKSRKLTMVLSRATTKLGKESNFIRLNSINSNTTCGRIKLMLEIYE